MRVLPENKHSFGGVHLGAKVLVVAKFFPPATPSRCARALQMAKVTDALCRAGCQLEVIAGLENCDTESEGRAYPVHYIPEFQDGRALGSPHRWIRAGVHMAERCIGSDWLGEARRVCLERCRTFRPDVLLTASLPCDSHLVGADVHAATAIPWVAFFSDPWPAHICPIPYRRPTPLYRRLAAMHTVRRILMQCDALVMTNSYGLQLMSRATGLSLRDKGHVIPHIGVSASCPEKLMPQLVHIGDLTRRCSPALIDAVKTVAGELPDRFRGLLCVGNAHDEYRDLAARMGAERHIQFIDHLPNAEAELLAAHSQVLLVIEAEMRESPFLPSKFADYARIGRPILAITPPRSAIRDYLRERGGGLAVTHHAADIADGIRTLFTAPSWCVEKGQVCSENLASSFEPERIATAYLEVLRSVTSEVCCP